MYGFDLFEFYRFMLAAMCCIYAVAKLALFIWRWRGISAMGSKRTLLLQRYVLALLLRTSLWRFVPDLLVIAGLLAVLALLLRWHWW